MVATAISCRNQISSSPELIGTFDSAPFQFKISIENAAPCRAWIVDNFARKISDVQNSVRSELGDLSCGGMSVPCMANSQFACDGSAINFR